MALDIGKSFKFMFDDQDWLKKIAIGGVLNIIPFVNLIPIGYALRTLKNVSEGHDVPLPEWDDWGGDFMKGLLAGFLAPLIYLLPLTASVIFFLLIRWLSGGSQYDGTGYTLCSTALSCLAVLYSLLVSVILPAAWVKYVETEEFGAFFRFGEIWQFIREHLSDYIIAILLMLVAGAVASLVGGIACGIGVFFTGFWATLVTAHLLGQIKAGSVPSAPTTYAPPVDYTGGEL